jgi:deuterolysin
MHTFSQISVAAVAFSALAGATAVDLRARDSPLTVTLSEVGNAVIKASITNSGSEDLSLLTSGTILDPSDAVEKLSVYSTGKLQCIHDNLGRTKTVIRKQSCI